MSTNPQALTVSALLGETRELIEGHLPLLWVAGEISGFVRAASGHCYFKLKDDRAQVSCVLYRHKAARVGVQLREGLAVELRVQPTLYEARGEFQLLVEGARATGEGALFEAFLRLKAQLQAEGIFDTERKRPLPSLPRAVGLITSQSGAAVHDMITTLCRRWPSVRIIVYPSLVQGVHAPKDLLRALAIANARAEVDALIIGRGGGSMEDLWAFNDEALVRAVAVSEIPIVSAVGHETDFTLCDFAADARAATPTAAAELVVPDVAALINAVINLAQRVRRAMQRRLGDAQQYLDELRSRSRHPAHRLEAAKAELGALAYRLSRCAAERTRQTQRELDVLATRLIAQRSISDAMRRNLVGHAIFLRRAANIAHREHQSRLNSLAERAMALNPEAVLARGFAWVESAAHRPIRSAQELSEGQVVSLRLHDGSRDAKILAKP